MIFVATVTDVKVSFKMQFVLFCPDFDSLSRFILIFGQICLDLHSVSVSLKGTGLH